METGLGTYQTFGTLLVFCRRKPLSGHSLHEQNLNSVELTLCGTEPPFGCQYTYNRFADAIRDTTASQGAVPT